MVEYAEKIEASKNEKEIQRVIANYIEQNTGWRIIEEDFSNIKGLQDHQFLLLNPVKNYFNGLRHYIEKFNKHIYNNPDYGHLDKTTITETILKDFISKYDAKNHIEIYEFLFNMHNNERSVIIDKKVNKPEKYNLLSFSAPVENEISVIKEKRYEAIRNSTQLPDFAIYLNGIPLFSIEVKTEKAGLGKAFEDYRSKEAYKKFIGCIGTTGKEAFISMMPNSPTFYYWEAYGSNKTAHNETGLEDLLSEIIFSKDNLMFYLMFSTFVQRGAYGDKVLMNHRCQQYYTLKKTELLLQSFENDSEKSFKKVVKHVQRSGKSITIKSVVNLIATKHPQLFSKIYIHVPDTVISKGIKNTFGDMTVHGTGKPIKKIETREEYNKSIEKEPSNLEVYLMNIQKVSAHKNYNKRYSKNNVLIIIDEVHTHQIGLSSEIRHKNFPNASFLTFTATPKMEESKKVLRNKTNTQYSDDDGYLDEFNASHALKLEIILPISYEKAKFAQTWQQTLNKKYDREQLKEIEAFIDKDEQLRQAIDDKVDTYQRKLEKDESLPKHEILKKVEEEEERIEKEEKERLLKASKNQNIKDVKESLIDDKIEFIIDDIKTKRIKTYSNHQKEPYFKTKSFWVVDSVEMAKKCLQKVQSLSNQDSLNKYKGIRFAVDYSENVRDEGEGDNFDTSNHYKSIEKLNKQVVYGNHIIDDFESEEDDSVDVLIIVGKYLMGYDESKLTTVYIDKTIRETSLLFQLITRPATIHPNKSKGYVVDLTFGEVNYNTFNKALTFYDNDEKLNTFILTDDIIKEEKDNIQKALKQISNVLKLDKIDELSVKNEGAIRDKIKTLDINDIDTYFEAFAQINQSFDVLVSPEYYYESMDYFYRLARINHWYLEQLNKNGKIHYTQSQIKNIIKHSLKALKIDSIDDIVKYELIGKQERLPEKEKETDYSDELHKATIKVNFNKPPATSTSFFDYSQTVLDELALSDMEDEENQKKLEALKKEIEDEKVRVENEIEQHFDGKRHFYFFYNIALSYLVDNQNDKLSKNIIQSFSKPISDSIFNDYIRFSLDEIADLELFSEKVASETDTHWKWEWFDSSIPTENLKPIYDLWKANEKDIIKEFVQSFVKVLREQGN